MIVHLIDGTYELFRHFYGLRRFTHVKGAASRGPSGAHIGVATDHVIESFRNRIWPNYETGDGIERWIIGVRPCY
jgi:hypothetical protein